MVGVAESAPKRLRYSPAAMPDAWLELDTELRAQLREVLATQQPLTEAEVRKLDNDGQACNRLLHAELERLEARLAVLDADPEASLGAIADAFRRVNGFRAHVEELDDLLAEFDDRAREVRTSWSQSLPRWAPHDLT
jgi:hypothetical protein